MGKKLHEEDIKLNIIVGNNQAQNKITELEAANRKLREEQTRLYELRNKLDAQGKKETAEYKNTVARLKELRLEISQNKAEIKKLGDTLGITGMTMQQLRRRASILRSELNNMVPGSGKYKMLQKELQAVTGRITELNAKAHAQKFTFAGAADWLNRYQTMLVGVVATLTGVVLSFQRWLDYAGKLSDQQANVMKTTQMTKQEVDDLTRSFGELETRTSKIDLLKIAEEGGRIGIAKNEMLDFVGVMDKASVALGDSFTGGVEEVSAVLGKLKFLFEETKNLGVDHAYNAIGSAINDLGANGTATEDNIAEFATRVGSLPDKLKPTIAEALALGAAFEESGIEAEVSARAYNIFLKQASENTKLFGKVMGVSASEVERMINEDPVNFFLEFAKKLKGVNPEGVEMQKMLQKLGINADGANKIIGAAANNNDRFRESINLSNKSTAVASSLLAEYNVKNNTLQATMDKIKKTVTGWFSSETLLKWLEESVYWFAKLIGATEDADGSGKKWREGLILAAKLITILIAGVLSYNAGMKMYVLWTTRATAGSLLFNLNLKIQNALAAISIIRTGLMTAANALFTKGIRAAIIELRTMNAVLGVSPWGALAAVIGVVVSSLILFRQESEKAVTAQRLLNSVNAEAKKSIASQVKETELLLKVARDENLEKDKRLQAIKRLNEIIPGYNDLLNLEKINTLEASAAVKQYTDELYKNARAKALQSKFDELEGQKLDIEQAPAKDYRSTVQKTIQFLYGGYIGESSDATSREEIEQSVRALNSNLTEAEINQKIQEALIASGFLNKEQKINDILAQQKVLEQEMLAILKGDPNALNDSGNSDASGSFDLGDDKADKEAQRAKEKAAKKREQRIKEIIAENEKLSQELLQIQRENEDAQIDIMEEGFQKEQSQLQTEHGRKIEDLKRQIVDAATIAKLEEEKAAASKAGDKEKAGLLDGLISTIKERNAELNNAILQAQITYEYKRGTIHAKFIKKRVDELQKELNDEKKFREQRFNEELIALGTTEAIKDKLKDTLTKKELGKIKTWEDAKAALKKQYDAEDIQSEIAHTEELISIMNEALSSGSFEGLDIELMTPEQKKEFLDTIEELKAKLIELGVAKADLQNGGKSDELGSSDSYGMGGQTDILGMSPDNWVQFIDNIRAGKFELEELTATVSLLQNAFSQYYAYVQANEQRNINAYEQNVNRRRNSLKKQLDQGIISQETYDKKIAKLEEEADRRRAEMEYKAAMNQWRNQLINAIVGTAMATINGYNTQPFWPTGLIMGTLAGVLGTVQIATINKNKPVKGFEKGLYPEEFEVIREQDGKPFNARYGGQVRSGLVDKPTVFMAGERGVEMIIDSQAYRQFHPDLRRDLHNEIARVKGYEGGYYPKDINPDSNGPDGNNEMLAGLIAQNNAIMQQNADLLEIITKQGVRSYMVLTYEEIEKLQKRQDEYQVHKNKNRI